MINVDIVTACNTDTIMFDTAIANFEYVIDFSDPGLIFSFNPSPSQSIPTCPRVCTEPIATTGPNAGLITTTVDAQTGTFAINTIAVSMNTYLLHGETYSFTITCTSTDSTAGNNVATNTFDVTFKHTCADAFSGAIAISAGNLPVNGVVTSFLGTPKTVPITEKSNGGDILCGSIVTTAALTATTQGATPAPPAVVAAGDLTITPNAPAQKGIWNIDVTSCFVNFPSVCMLNPAVNTFNLEDPCTSMVVSASGTLAIPFIMSVLEGTSGPKELPTAF